MKFALSDTAHVAELGVYRRPVASSASLGLVGRSGVHHLTQQRPAVLKWGGGDSTRAPLCIGLDSLGGRDDQSFAIPLPTFVDMWVGSQRCATP